MSEFNPDKFLLDLQKSDLDAKAKEKCEKLRINLKYVAPELLGEYFFHGFKSTTGLCQILQESTENNPELNKDMTNRYSQICTEYTNWRKKFENGLENGLDK